MLKVVPQFKLEYYLCDSPEELDTDFEEYVSHHELDAALDEEMRKLEE